MICAKVAIDFFLGGGGKKSRVILSVFSRTIPISLHLFETQGNYVSLQPLQSDCKVS